MSAVIDPGLAANGPPLSPEDSHRLVGVLDDVSAAAGDPSFFDQIRDSIGRHFGWADVVVDIPAEFGEFPDGARCVHFRDGADLGHRERATMQRLARYLAPWVRSHFAATRLQREHALLSARERDTAELAARGLSNREIAERLHVTVDTVKKHLTRAMAKTRCTSRTQLAMRFQH